MCALCEIHSTVHLWLSIFLYIVIFQLKSVKKRRRIYFRYLLTHISFFTINYKLEEKKRRKLVCESKEIEKGGKNKKSAFLQKATKPRHKRKAGTTSPVTIVMKLSFCN